MRWRGSIPAGLVVALSLTACRSAPPAPLPPVPPTSGSLLVPPTGVAAAPAPLADGQTVVDRVVAEVNGEVITMSELQEAVLVYLRDTRERPPESAQETMEVQRRVLRRLVDVRLQVQEARREKIQVTDEEIQAVLEDLARRSEADRAELERRKADSRAWERTRRELRDQLLAQRIRGRRLSRRASVTEAEVDAYVAANRAKLEGDLKYHPRHIAVLAQPAGQPAAWTEARAKIDMLRGEIVAGADFAEVARQHSQDGSARAGGDLGWLARGELQPIFEEAILRLERGGVTEPIRSASGFHLFLLQDREEVSSEGLAQFRQQARDLLLQKKVQERQDEWLDDLRRRALIAVRL